MMKRFSQWMQMMKQAECSCIISSTSPSGKAAYFRPFHQVTGLMLPTLNKDDGKGSDRL